MAYSPMPELYRYISETKESVWNEENWKKASKSNKFQTHHNTSDRLEFLEESHLEGKQLSSVFL